MNSPVNARVVRHFNAPSEAVFRAWLDEEKVKHWFAPGLGENVRVEIDPHVGGKFCFVQRRDGADVEHVGQYLEIDPPRRLLFTWRVPPSPETSRVHVDIVPHRSGCEVTVTHELHPDWADFIARSEAAWGKMLDAMALQM